ncbi:MAG: hypothetical protein LW832_02140 [Parachlamydia sp.]|nr:hypothetical protein [Parachlamydia sp.]
MQVNNNLLKFYYIDQYRATVVGQSRQELLAWWLSVKNKDPFTKVLVDRNDDARNTFTMQVGLGYQNDGIKILDIFKEALIICENKPPKNPGSSRK